MNLILNYAPSRISETPLVLMMWSRGRNSLSPSRINKQRIQIHSSCRIFQNHNTLETKFVTMQDAKRGKIPLRDYSLAASINAELDQHGQKKFILNKPCISMSDRKECLLFISIRDYGLHTDHRGYKLKQGDLIKIGTKKIRIVKISSDIPVQTTPNQFEDYRRVCRSFYFPQQMQKGTCKICLSQDTDVDDFILKPCKCKGSCSDVHFSCLKRWMETKVSSTSSSRGRVISHCFKKFQCQICKSQLPRCIIVDNLVNYLFSPRIPFREPYLILEFEGELNWHIITLRQLQSIQIGRSLASDIVVTSADVSKMHCEILFNHDHFYVKDLHSELGTFVQLKQGFEIAHTTTLEYRGTFYQFRHGTNKNSINERRFFA